MNTLKHFKDFVTEITASNSKKYKQEILQKYKDDSIVHRYLKIAFNPYATYGISTKKLHKVVPATSIAGIHSVFELFTYLVQHNTGTDQIVGLCQDFLAEVAACDIESADLLEKLICKDLSIGVDAKTINSVIPGLIPQFSCMLAERYFDRPQYVEGKEFAITTKLDGFRLVVVKGQDGNIKCYSRVGQLLEGLIEIEEEIRNQLPCNIALDGELTISNYFDMPSKAAYKAASKIITLKDDTPKTGLTYRVFDCMTADEFKMQQCDKTYVERRMMLESFPAMAHVEVLPVLYQGSDTSKITEWLNKITAEGGEGCMVNLTQAKYQWRRSRDLLKVKKFQSLDLLVVGYEEGSGRLAGMLGAIHVRYKGGNIVKVGSGFSDEERKLYFEHPELIMSRIVEIKYFEELKSSRDNTFSLRFPTWVSNIRDPRDKANPDF